MPSLEIDSILVELAPLALAFALAFPLGWERGQTANSVGFRTLPLVSIAACGFSLILDSGVAEVEHRARVMQGVITGIGFIGGGAIVKTDRHVDGLATAASIWTAGAIGLAVGYGKINIAIVLSMASFLSLLILSRLRPKEEGDDP